MKSLLILFILINQLLHQDQLMIRNDGFDDIFIGKTTLREINEKYPKAKHEKLFQHAMFRTEQGRICLPITKEKVTLKKQGVEFYFNYTIQSEDSITVDRIDFIKPSKAQTELGISLGSGISKVKQVYGEPKSGESASFDYGWIKFYINKKNRVERISLRNK